MEKKTLGDPEEYPSDEVIAGYLGRASAAYFAMVEGNRAEHPDFEELWKYYGDVKSWLYKVSRKKKTQFWLSVDEGSFRGTFYLGLNAEDALLGSSLPEELKDQYRQSKGKKFHGVTVVVRTKKDLAAYRELLAIKMAAG